MDRLAAWAKNTRALTGWGALAALTCLELIVSTLLKRSSYQSSEAIVSFINLVAEWAPVVESFDKCSVATDASTGLLLALSAASFPVKLAALYIAYPARVRIEGAGWVLAWRAFYLMLIALVAIIPTLMFYAGWANIHGHTGLASINRKVDALCVGGLPAFIAAQIQGGFALLCAHTSVRFLVTVGRTFQKVDDSACSSTGR